MKFLRNLLAVVLGFFIAIFLMMMFFAAIGSFAEKEKKEIKDNSVLVLDMKGALPDYVPSTANPFEKLFDEVKGISFTKLLNAIENAKNDEKIKGISLEFPLLNIGVAQAQELRDRLEDFKASGKFVTAYSDIYSLKNYYISSVADSIFIQPEGNIDFRGLSVEKLYFKDFQDKYGIKFEVIRHGKYKSAMEGFLSDKMSDANRKQLLSLLHSIWGEILEDIAKSRGMTVENLNAIVDERAPATPDEAVAEKLLDHTLYEDQYRARLAVLTGKQEGQKPERLSIKDYIEHGKGRKSQPTLASDAIAVLYAQGNIQYGKGDETYIGQESMIKAIRKIRKSKKIKAVVLRVNSPGGSALVSDMIWRELKLLGEEKPIVVSMGNYAASGGYYISCMADMIIAEPTTITGSIGVFGALPNLHGFVTDKGINAEQVYTNTSPHYSLFEPATDDFQDYMKRSIDKVYRSFVSHVAQGRKMTFEKVDSIAQGRVWTGKEAQEIGLVDALGSLDDAILAAAQSADLQEYKVKKYPRYKKDFKEMFESTFPFGKTKGELLSEELGEEYYTIYRQLKQMQSAEGVQARMPYLLEIK